jgi:hypothetical protein
MLVPQMLVIKILTVILCALTMSVNSLAIMSNILLNAKEYTCKCTLMFPV